MRLIGRSWRGTVITELWKLPKVGEHERQVWAGGYLTRGGWRGYDPSPGLAVAVSVDYRGTVVGLRLGYARDLQVRKRT